MLRMALIASLAFSLVACVGDAAIIQGAPDSSVNSAGDSSPQDGAKADTSPVDAGPCPGKSVCQADGGPMSCADLTSDPNNCGACGHYCPSKACANSDCVRRVFLSSTFSTGEAGGVTGNGGEDSSCQALAVAAGLDGKYMAWLSSDATSPSMRFTKSKAPYVRVDNTKVANDWAGLTSGTLLVPINRDEKGNVVSTMTDVWTDTAIDGKEVDGGSNCGSWTTTLGGKMGTFGHATSTDATWTNAAPIVCTAYDRFYCFEQ